MNQPINKITREDIAAFQLCCNALPGEWDRNALDLYQSIATKNSWYPGQGSPVGLSYVALKGCGEAGEFAEHAGKAMRDDGIFDVITLPDGRTAYVPKKLTDDRRDLLIGEIGDELWYIAAKCNELGVRLSDVAAGNLTKLCDRSERGVLQGEGDRR